MQTTTTQLDWRAIRLYCRMYRISFRQLAIRSGYARQSLYRMEKTGKNGPEAPDKIARVLAVPISTICLEEYPSDESETASESFEQSL